jgi:F0F1-type ATP synthase delta subunit
MSYKYSFEELYNVLKKELLSNNDIDDNDKAKIFMEMCRSYDKIINGSSELININHILNIINKMYARFTVIIAFDFINY